MCVHFPSALRIIHDKTVQTKEKFFSLRAQNTFVLQTVNLQMEDLGRKTLEIKEFFILLVISTFTYYQGSARTACSILSCSWLGSQALLLWITPQNKTTGNFIICFRENTEQCWGRSLEAKFTWCPLFLKYALIMLNYFISGQNCSSLFF